MEAQELSYLKRFNREWDELLGECSRYKHKCEKLEQENRELKEKLLTAEARCGILEERGKDNYIQLDNGRMAGSYPEGGGGGSSKRNKYPTYHLDEDEYAHVCSEISSNYSRYKNRKVAYILLSEATYNFENHGFGDYNIFDKEE